MNYFEVEEKAAAAMKIMAESINFHVNFIEVVIKQGGELFILFDNVDSATEWAKEVNFIARYQDEECAFGQINGIETKLYW